MVSGEGEALPACGRGVRGEDSMDLALFLPEVCPASHSLSATVSMKGRRMVAGRTGRVNSLQDGCPSSYPSPDSS